jgi:hypothetical protein
MSMEAKASASIMGALRQRCSSSISTPNHLAAVDSLARPADAGRLPGLDDDRRAGDEKMINFDF